MSQRKLGLGLEALLGGITQPVAVIEESRPAAPRPDGISELPLADIRPNPFQPRTVFDDADLQSLAASIRQSGVIQPVVVRRAAAGFELVAGERRFRAAKLAGLSSIPVVIRVADDRQMLHLAVVENLQRRDLNPIEKAKAFRQLMQLNAWTQDQAAEAVGLSRSSVANFIRLLDLPAEIQEAVSRGTLSMGHARALLATSNAALQRKMLKRIVDEDLSVRVVEKMIAPSASPAPRAGTKDPHLQDLERRFTQFFGTRVELSMRKRGGKIVVTWFSNDQFNSILRKLGV